MKERREHQETAAGQLVEMTVDERCRALLRLYVSCPELLCQSHADQQRHQQIEDLFRQAGRIPPWRDHGLIQRALGRHNFLDSATRPYLETLLAEAERKANQEEQDGGEPWPTNVTT